MSFTTGHQGAAPYHANDHRTDISRKYKRPETAWEEFERLRSSVISNLPSHRVEDFSRVMELKDDMTSGTVHALGSRLADAENHAVELVRQHEQRMAHELQELAALREENAVLREIAEKVSDADAYFAKAERALAEANDLKADCFRSLRRIRSERGLS